VGETLPLGESVFAAQPRQGEFPVSGFQVPPAHGEQLLPSVQVHPAGQMQAATAMLFLGECEFDGHCVHFTGPIYMFRGHPQ